jgi:hypothetical protein
VEINAEPGKRLTTIWTSRLKSALGLAAMSLLQTVIVIGVLTDQVHLGGDRKCPSDRSAALSMEPQRPFFFSHPQHPID